MSIYETMEAAMHGQDPETYVGLFHDDFQFVRHQSGTTMDKAAMADMIRRMVASGGLAVQNQRCLYENGDILVEHSVMDFPDGTGKRCWPCTCSRTARSSGPKPARHRSPSSGRWTWASGSRRVGHDREVFAAGTTFLSEAR